MYKNQLQELAQRSCFNLPSYSCIRAGPDHAPRFKATVNFNGELFDSPYFCSTLRQAEHAAAEVALNTLLYRRGPTQSLAAKILDETGICKNLLQETAQRAGVPLPFYTTTRSGPGHMPVFTCVVEIAGLKFYGEAAKTKKQAEKNAAMAAWSKWKQFAKHFGGGAPTPPCSSEEMTEDQEQTMIARVLSLFYEKTSGASSSSKPVPPGAPSGHSRESSTDLGRGYSSHSNQPVRSGPSSFFGTNREAATRDGVRIRTESSRNVHEVSVALEEHQRDEEEWLRPPERQAPAATADEGKQCKPQLWSRTAAQGWSLSDSSRLAGYNLRFPAPPVRVRSVVAVSAAPPERLQPRPQPPPPPPQEAENDVAGVFSRLKL